MNRIVVAVHNRPGVIAELTAALARDRINIEQLDAAALDSQGIIILATDRNDDALALLAEHGFRAVTDDTVLFQLDDQPGALAAAAERLRQHGINIRALHLLERDHGRAIAALSCDNHDLARQLLADSLIQPDGQDHAPES